jgi:hypothetical protein
MKLTTQKFIIIMNRPKRCTTTICLWKICPYLCHGQRALQFCAKGCSRLRWNGDDESQMHGVVNFSSSRKSRKMNKWISCHVRVALQSLFFIEYLNCLCLSAYVLAKMHAISILIKCMQSCSILSSVHMHMTGHHLKISKLHILFLFYKVCWLIHLNIISYSTNAGIWKRFEVLYTQNKRRITTVIRRYMREYILMMMVYTQRWYIYIMNCMLIFHK